jgi:hypothetical protein
LAEYVASDQLPQMTLESLLSKLSFPGNEKFSKDGQVAKVQELAGRVTQLTKTLGEMMDDPYNESLSEAARRMRLAREDTAQFVEQLRRARLISMSRDRVSILERARHLAEYAKMAGDHRLLELFDALPGTRQAELQGQAVRVAAEHGEGSQVQLREVLAMLNNAFVQWRYVYELPRSGTVHLQQAILAMHACRDVCLQAVKP